MVTPYPYLIELPVPILTPRLLIRPPQAGDGPAYYEAVIDSMEHLQAFLPWPSEYTSQEFSENNVRRLHSLFLERSNIALALFDRQTQRLIGGSGLHRIDWDIPSFEIGYWIRQDAEGQGYISEAVNAITRYAFDHLKARRVHIRCEAANVRSQAVAKRLGYDLEGIMRQDRYKFTVRELTDTHIYARLDTTDLPPLEVSW